MCVFSHKTGIGKWQDWEFYGGSVAFSPEGELINKAANKEEILIVDIQKEKVKEAIKEWKFRKNLGI